MEKKKKLIILGVILLLIIVSGATFAILTWNSTMIKLGINTNCFTIDYTRGGDITGSLKLINEDNMIISSTNRFVIKEGVGISGVNIGINSNCSIEGFGSIYLNVTNISDAFTTGDSKGALKYAVLRNTSTITDPANITTASLLNETLDIVTKGSITSNEKKLLYRTELSNAEVYKYIVVIYIDNNLAGNDITSATFSGNISSEAEQKRYGETPEYCFTLSNKDETNKTASISGYNCCDSNSSGYETITNVVIPQEIEGYTINTIGNNVFNSKQLTSVSLPDTITTINLGAFFNNKLKNINLPKSLITIGKRSFDSNQLTSIIIPNSVSTIGDRAFNSNQITSINLPSSVTSITGGVFDNNPLTSITVDSNNTVYDSRDNSNAIIETSSNTLIQGSQNTIIPNTITTIGEDAFFGVKLTNISIPNSVTTIGNYAFQNNSLTSIIIPNSVTTIGVYAFRYNSLTSINIPNSVATINNLSFANNQITSINLPSSVTKVAYGAFSFNPLASITVDSNNSVYDSRDNCNAIIETSSNTLIQGSQSTIIPNSVTAIGTGTFYGIKLTNMTIPNSVIKIGSSAFAYSQLKSIIIPNSIITIENYTFQDNRLTSVTIPDSVTTIGDYAFYENQLTSVTIPDSVTTIRGCAFAFNNLNYVYIGSNSKLANINYGTFSSSERTLTSSDTGTTYVDNPNLKKIYYNGNKQLPWIYAINGNNSSTKFVTGIVPSYTFLGSTYNEVLITTGK